MTELVTRAFAAELDLDGDGRTIVGRCVPYDTPALVADGGEPYTEVWKRGAFRGALRDPPRVHLVWAHDETAIGNRLGHAVALVESDAGLEGTFRTIGQPGEHALELIRAGMARGLSIHAAIVRSRTRTDGIVERQAARLLHVALVTEPAYADARVTAVRGSSSGPVSVSVAEVRAQQANYRLRYAPSVPADAEQTVPANGR
jgi:HK97 family phage prohead protease